LKPATQEKVLAYEIGAKATLLERTLQVNAALFYYDYTDKQIRGRIIDPLGIFGALETDINVPKSRIEGAELQILYQPIPGLVFGSAVTYLESKVTSNFENYDPLANVINFNGLKFPYTPSVSAVSNLHYEKPVGDNLVAFVDGGYNYQSSTTTAFAIPGIVATTPSNPRNQPGATVPGNIFTLPGRGLVDGSVGFSSPTHNWRASLWIRNALDKYYLTNVIRGADTIYGYAGMPRTYGIAASFRF
jgi:iron complex outermembrane receptor protein